MATYGTFCLLLGIAARVSKSMNNAMLLTYSSTIKQDVGSLTCDVVNKFTFCVIVAFRSAGASGLKTKHVGHQRALVRRELTGLFQYFHE